MYPKCLFALNIHLVQFCIKSKQVDLSLRQHFFAISNYLVYDNFCCPFFVAKYHPAGYSSEYSAGRKFASRIFSWNNTFIIKQKNPYGQNESYLTQRHTKVFQNIKLASPYSKSMSHENSKWVDFVSVQVKDIVQNGSFFLSFQTE